MRMIMSSVSLFSIFNRVALLAVAVSTMAVTSVTVTVVMEQHQSHQVRCETETSDNQHQDRVCDNLRLHKSLDGVEEDGDTQCDQEDAVDERSQGFCALIAVCVHLWGGALVCHLDGPETNAEGQNIVEHVK